MGLECGGRLEEVWPEFFGFLSDLETSLGSLFEDARQSSFFSPHPLETFRDSFLPLLQLEQSCFQLLVLFRLFFHMHIHRSAFAFHFVQSSLHILVLEVQGFDPGFGGFGFIEVFIDGRSLRLPKTDEVDDVGKYLHQAVMVWFEEVGE